MYANVAEADAASGNEWTRQVADYARGHEAGTVVISAEIESQLAQLPEDEQKEFLASLGLDEAGLNKLIREGYKLLGLQTYFTVGPKEARAWTIHKGDKAPQAAGVIHSDFERGFIRAQTIAYEDYVALGGEQPAKEAGRMRVEGKAYRVADGDVMHFLFNA
jgi:ribosome-binding ATPase